MVRPTKTNWAALPSTHGAPQAQATEAPPKRLPSLQAAQADRERQVAKTAESPQCALT
jgi:hypothetical protein